MENPAYELVSCLRARGWTVTFAESCTGGLCAARLVDVPDASSVFAGSLVTYSPEMKTELAGVDPELIRTFGVVSPQVALAMARGAAARLHAQAAVGISGVAGPTGGTRSAPVGTVCFGFVAGQVQTSETVCFGDLGRSAVRERSAEYALQKLLVTMQSCG